MDRIADSGFDELKYGRARTLDLHGSLSAEDAMRRAESWMRERQVARAGEVLVITGRGRGSADGVAVLRPAIARLFTRLKRLGVVENVSAHNEGSFAVKLAPVKALFEAAPRARASYPAARAEVPEFAGLSAGTRAALHELAVRALEELGAQTTPALVESEMHRQIALLAPGLPAGEDPDIALARIAREVMETMGER